MPASNAETDGGQIADATIRISARETAGIGALAAALIAATIVTKRRSRTRATSVKSGVAQSAVGVRQIDRNVWTLEDVTPYGFMDLPIRMTIIRLTGGDLLLHSPVPFSPRLAREVERLGSIRYMVAPNTVHWMHMTGWQRAYPQAEVWAVEGLKERTQVRDAGLRIDRQLGDETPEAWADDLVIGVVPGGRRFRECFILHRSTRTLVLCDLIENLETGSVSLRLGLLARALGATRARTAIHVRAILLLEARAARAAVERMVALEPKRLILAHGGLIEHDASARLREAFRWLL